MAKRFPFVVPYKEFVKHIQSTTTPKAAVVSTNRLCFSNANHVHLHTQDGDPVNEGAAKATEVLESVGETAKEGSVDTAWDAAKNTAKLVTETTMAEADTNVVDTVEYRSSEDLKGQLGDGCDKIEL